MPYVVPAMPNAIHAAPFPLALAGHPRMDPTNNESSRMSKKAVTADKLRFRMAGRPMPGCSQTSRPAHRRGGKKPNV